MAVELEKVRVGMIGVGVIAQEHLKRMKLDPRVEVVALCDPNPAAIAKTREKHGDYVAGARDFSDYRSLLEAAKPQAVILSTLHSDHFSQILDCLDAGAHVLTEKPLVNNASDAREVVRRAKESDKVVGISYQRHALPFYAYVHRAIRSGEYGPVVAVNSYLQQEWKLMTAGSWRQDPAISGGGFLHDSGSHIVDFLLWSTGLTAQSVSAYIDNRGTPVDIVAAVSVRFHQGAVGSMLFDGDTPSWNESVTIFCERAVFYLRTAAPLIIMMPDKTKYTPTEEELPVISDIDRNFINAIFGEEEIAAPPICGLRAMELTEAAWRSSEAGGIPIQIERIE